MSPEVGFPQGDEKYCVTYSAASAMLHAGDHMAATKIAALAPGSLQLAAGTNRRAWVQAQCRQVLQLEKPHAWRVLKLKGPQLLDTEALLEQLAGDAVSVIQLEDSGGNVCHCVAACGGWLFDTNKSHAVPLDAGGLDRCCLDEATFVKVMAGFRLERAPTKKAKVAGEPPAKKARV